MKRNLLQSNDQATVEDYVFRKFKKLNAWYYSSATRDEKCIKYFLAANTLAQGIIKNEYLRIFKKPFPEDKANAIREAKASQDAQKFLRTDALEGLEDQAEQLQTTLNTLRQWKTARRFEGGDRFFLDLQQLMAQLDGGQEIVDTSHFETEFKAYLDHHLTHSVEVTDKSVSAEFEAMLGFQQTAGLTFDARSARWGKVEGSLNEALKVGTWASGSVEAELKKIGFN